MSEMIQVETRNCPECGQSTWLTVDARAHEQWTQGYLSIQHAFPDLSTDEREMLMTGLHGACWDAYLGPEEDEDEYDDWVDGWADDDNGLSGGYYEDDYDSDLEWSDLF